MASYKSKTQRKCLWKRLSPNSDGKQRWFLFHFYVRTEAFCVAYKCCGNKIEGCGLQLRDSPFQDSLAASFLPSFLTSSFESWGWQDYLLVCAMVFTGPWFSHKHMNIGGEGSVDWISSTCFSHSFSTFFPNSFDFLNYLMPFGVFFHRSLGLKVLVTLPQSWKTAMIQQLMSPIWHTTTWSHLRLTFWTEAAQGCSQPASSQPLHP